jgi:hypothetical protein
MPDQPLLPAEFHILRCPIQGLQSELWHRYYNKRTSILWYYLRITTRLFDFIVFYCHFQDFRVEFLKYELRIWIVRHGSMTGGLVL